MASKLNEIGRVCEKDIWQSRLAAYGLMMVFKAPTLVFITMT